MKWIDLKEQMPTEFRTYLISDDRIYYSTGVWIPKIKEFSLNDEDHAMKVTHWMEFPFREDRYEVD